MAATHDRIRLAPGDHLGKYELLEELGRGGMAEVWKARASGPAGFKRTLVLKRILPVHASDEHFVQMFLAEARLSAQLHHPNIVAVHDLGDSDGQYFIVMEYLRARTLNQVLRALLSSGPPKIGLAVYVVREMARALGYAHGLVDEAGRPLRLIHRDVSPTNVMLGFDGTVKLVDFGIAKAIDAADGEHTRTGTLKGKFSYMAPEQVLGRDVDHRIDLYAAGIVLWECLTGKRLFKGTSDMDTVELVKKGRIAAPSTHNPLVPLGLDAIALKALARNPDERYASGEAMAHDLEQVAHELRWGSDALVELMKELFPDGSSESLRAPPVEERSSSGDSRRWLRWVGAALGLASVGMGALAWHKGLLRVPELPSLVPEKKAPPPLAPTVRIAVTSTPPGAAVYVDGEAEPLGLTPLTLMLPATSGARRLRLSLVRYKDALEEVLPDRARTVEVKLERAAPRRHGPLIPRAHPRGEGPPGDEEAAAPDPSQPPPVAGDDE